MKRIGLLSDTHGDVPEGLRNFFEKCDEIWHAGDIGNDAALLELTGNRMLRAVYGNIDGTENRIKYPERLRFFCENTEVVITHIGGYPGNYDRSIRQEISTRPPKMFICGHSHILKVIYDKKLEMLHLNPGAAGIYGWHKFSTALRFIIDGSDIRELEIWEKERERRG
jgi:putative phosphoesterase